MKLICLSVSSAELDGFLERLFSLCVAAQKDTHLLMERLVTEHWRPPLLSWNIGQLSKPPIHQ